MRKVVACVVLATLLLGFCAGCRTYSGIAPAPTAGNYFIVGKSAWGNSVIWEATYTGDRFKIVRTVQSGW